MITKTTSRFFHFYWSGAYTQQINLKNDKIVYNVNRGQLSRSVGKVISPFILFQEKRQQWATAMKSLFESIKQSRCI